MELEEEGEWSEAEWPIDLSTCPSSIKCPKPVSRDDCKGNWWNTASDASTPNPDCPSKPSSITCNPVVLGRCNDTYSDICKYRNCPGYIALNMNGWNLDQNDRFIACAQAGLLDNQCKDITIGSPSDHVPDPEPGTDGSVTYRELCQLKACGCPPTFKGDGGTASGCIGTGDGGTDGGTDAGSPGDGGTRDGGTDAGSPGDAGARDGGSDAGSPGDAGTRDGGSDAGTAPDAGKPDAGKGDSGVFSAAS